MSSIIFKKDYLMLYTLLSIVYISGLFIPLMENDSAQHASMAMRMYLDNDFLNIYKGVNDYLDKPHMHFWLAAISFKLCGISHWAYRIPALVFTLIGAFSCGKLAKTFYGYKATHIASLVFLSAQAIILANHDVRTDAVLTGATIFSVWQLVLYIKYLKLKNIILGTIGLGIAFSSKGQLGVLVVGISILVHLIYTKKWYALWNWKTIIGILFFSITITPVLYAYYLQFDLHPEKVINGKTNVSGIRFILWDQSFNRFTSEGFKKPSSDFSFFFHTLLWAFLPWSIITYIALFKRLKTLIKTPLNQELLTSLGFLIVLIIISFSKSKLPHYLNSLLPIASVLVAGYLVELFEKRKTKLSSLLLKIQYGVLSLGAILITFISLWAFPVTHIFICLSYLALAIGFVFLITESMNRIRKLIVVSVYFMVLINFSLNMQFYPNLLNYQAGNNALEIIEKEQIDLNSLYMPNTITGWSLDFYTKRMTPRIDIINDLKPKQWVFVYEKQLQQLKKNNISWSKQFEIDHYRITKLTLPFLNPNTRQSVLKKAYLLQIK